MADIATEWLEEIVAPRKPWLVTRTMPPIPLEAEAPLDLVTPGTASPAASASARAFFQNVDRRHIRVEQIERRKVVGQQRRVGEAGETVLGCGARHGHRPFGQGVEAVGAGVVG